MGWPLLAWKGGEWEDGAGLVGTQEAQAAVQQSGGFKLLWQQNYFKKQKQTNKKPRRAARELFCGELGPKPC